MSYGTNWRYHWRVHAAYGLQGRRHLFGIWHIVAFLFSSLNPEVAAVSIRTRRPAKGPVIRKFSFALTCKPTEFFDEIYEFGGIRNACTDRSLRDHFRWSFASVGLVIGRNFDVFSSPTLPLRHCPLVIVSCVVAFSWFARSFGFFFGLRGWRTPKRIEQSPRAHNIIFMIGAVISQTSCYPFFLTR